LSFEREGAHIVAVRVGLAVSGPAIDGFLGVRGLMGDPTLILSEAPDGEGVCDDIASAKPSREPSTAMIGHP
jgi:hypothetical protein